MRLTVKLQLDTVLLNEQIERVVALAEQDAHRARVIMHELEKRTGQSLVSLRKRITWEGDCCVCTVFLAFTPSFLNAAGVVNN